MVFCKLLNKISIRQNIRHSLSNNFPAGLVIGHFAACILLQLLLDQIMHILSALGKCIEHYLSKLIVLDRIPIFNKMCKFMCESSQHKISVELVGIVNITKSSIQVNIEGTGLISVILALGFFIRTFRIWFRSVQHNINAGSLCCICQILIGHALRKVECFVQILDCNAITTNNTLFASFLTIGSNFVFGVFCFGLSISGSLSCLMGQLLLGIGQVTG